MPVRLYDTLSRSVRELVPLHPGRVGLYVCGPTVQAPPHIGHVRSAVVFDLLVRWLVERGLAVTYVRNVTDIDDKILAAAAETGEPFWALAERNHRAFADAYAAVGCRPPTLEPRATGHIPEQVELIRRLVERGHAYAAGGDVYFDVRSVDGYGRLSGQRPDAMQPAESPAGKRDPLDFTLWKAAKPGEPSWSTPWGPGRPGWHLECSAMATRYLGTRFDLHGGGLDLVFPHHENELAQSTAAGDPFAAHWMHHGLLNVGREKMSKSVGNSLVVTEVLARVRPAALRYYLAAPHYRSLLDYSVEGLAEAETTYGRLESFVRNASRAVGAPAPAVAPAAGDGARPVPAAVAPGGPAGGAWTEFAAAMDDDLSVPRALGVVHGAVRSGNAALDAGDRPAAADWLAAVRRMLAVLGLDPVAQWGDGGGDLGGVVAALVSVALDARAAARARRDFAAADAIRESLTRAGVVVEDTPDGARWRLARG